VDPRPYPSQTRTQRLVVLALASSAGVHAALAPAHAAETPALGVPFALSALSLLGAAVAVDRAPEPATLGPTVFLLGSLLALYAATRFVALPPITPVEPVDALGAGTKLIEAAGMVLALRLWPTPTGSRRGRPFFRKESLHE
jgi:hypothetical protein